MSWLLQSTHSTITSCTLLLNVSLVARAREEIATADDGAALYADELVRASFCVDLSDAETLASDACITLVYFSTIDSSVCIMS